MAKITHKEAQRNNQRKRSPKLGFSTPVAVLIIKLKPLKNKKVKPKNKPGSHSRYLLASSEIFANTPKFGKYSKKVMAIITIGNDQR